MSFSEVISPLLGRFLLAWYFLGDAMRYARGWDRTVAQLVEHNVPTPELILFFMIFFMALGGIALMLGFRTKLGALFLFAIIMLWTITMDDYWSIAASASRQAEFDTFARNLAIAGGLLLLLGMGGGPFSMDNVQGGGKGKGGANPFSRTGVRVNQAGAEDERQYGSGCYEAEDQRHDQPCAPRAVQTNPDGRDNEAEPHAPAADERCRFVTQEIFRRRSGRDHQHARRQGDEI